MRLSPIYTRVKDPLYDLKNPPRFSSRSRQAAHRPTLSRAHTHNHTLRPFGTTPTVLRLHHKGPPDPRQQGRFHRFPDLRFFQRTYSISLPVPPLLFQQRCHARGWDLPKLVTFCSQDDCSLHSSGWLRLPIAGFWGSMFQVAPINPTNFIATL